MTRKRTLNQQEAHAIFTQALSTMPYFDSPAQARWLRMSLSTLDRTRRKERRVTRPLLRRIYRKVPDLRIRIRRVLNETPETIRAKYR